MVNRPLPKPARPPSSTGPRRGKPERTAPNLPDDGVVRIFREKGNRGGKTVTVVRGLRANERELADLALELKRLCGAGGTVRDGAIEVQGDHRDRIAEKLRALGHSVKLAGG
jgi:translation initiation factor 1